jgi:hypothetical protein
MCEVCEVHHQEGGGDDPKLSSTFSIPGLVLSNTFMRMSVLLLLLLLLLVH